jgi:hypothetical protein
VPLLRDAAEIQTATKLGPILSLPAPTRQDIEIAPMRNDWYWQPVGMDISQDNLAAVILTYRAVYYYERQAGQNWLAALNSVPLKVSLGNFENAEAVAFGDHARTVVVTGENEHSLVLSVDMTGAMPQ